MILSNGVVGEITQDQYSSARCADPNVWIVALQRSPLTCGKECKTVAPPNINQCPGVFYDPSTKRRLLCKYNETTKNFMVMISYVLSSNDPAVVVGPDWCHLSRTSDACYGFLPKYLIDLNSSNVSIVFQSSDGNYFHQLQFSNYSNSTLFKFLVTGIAGGSNVHVRTDVSSVVVAPQYKPIGPSTCVALTDMQSFHFYQPSGSTCGTMTSNILVFRTYYEALSHATQTVNTDSWNEVSLWVAFDKFAPGVVAIPVNDTTLPPTALPTEIPTTTPPVVSTVAPTTTSPPTTTTTPTPSPSDPTTSPPTTSPPTTAPPTYIPSPSPNMSSIAFTPAPTPTPTIARSSVPTATPTPIATMTPKPPSPTPSPTKAPPPPTNVSVTPITPIVPSLAADVVGSSSSVVTTVSSVGSPASSASVGMIAALSQNECTPGAAKNATKSMSWSLNPAYYLYEDQYSPTVANTLMLWGILSFHALVMLGMYAWKRDWITAMTMSKWPGVGTFPLMFLYHSIVTNGWGELFVWESSEKGIVVLICMCVGGIGPIVCIYLFIRNIQSSAHYDSTARVWMNVDSTNACQRVGMMFESFRDGTELFLLIELVQHLLIAMGVNLARITTCIVQVSVVMCVLASCFLIKALKLPKKYIYLNLTDGAVIFCELIAMTLTLLFLTKGMYENEAATA
eukprot:PhF_6_TR34139/c0_g1_i1/m.49855